MAIFLLVLLSIIVFLGSWCNELEQRIEKLERKERP